MAKEDHYDLMSKIPLSKAKCSYMRTHMTNCEDCRCCENSAMFFDDRIKDETMTERRITDSNYTKGYYVVITTDNNDAKIVTEQTALEHVRNNPQSTVYRLGRQVKLNMGFVDV